MEDAVAFIPKNFSNVIELKVYCTSRYLFLRALAHSTGNLTDLANAHQLCTIPKLENFDRR